MIYPPIYVRTVLLLPYFHIKANLFLLMFPHPPKDGRSSKRESIPLMKRCVERKETGCVHTIHISTHQLPFPQDMQGLFSINPPL